VSACSASVTPRNAAPGASDLYTITVNNDSNSAISWIKITFPPQGFHFAGHYITGWTLGGGVTNLTLSGNSIPAGESRDFVLAMNADVTPVASTSWKVEADDDSDHSSLADCGGILAMSISSTPPQVTNGVSNINVSNVTSSSATISWVTSVATTSIVYYGQTNAYGEHVYDPTQSINHTLQLSGLQSSTGYHFQVGGSNNQNNNAYSADNTFATSAKPPASSTGSTGGGGSNAPVQPVPAKVEQRGTRTDAPPQVSLTTVLGVAYKVSPVIQGIASDAVAVAKIEYSTDGGRNWLPTDVQQGLGGKSVVFTFTPVLSQDGNYQIVARATDSNGSIAVTASQLLVIDRLPPAVGASIFKAGSQQVNPAGDGLIHAAQGVDQRVVIGAIGGPTSVQLVAVNTIDNRAVQSFSLARSPDTGLWSGVLAFQTTGSFVLTAKAVDGAHNVTERKLANVIVAEPLKVTDARADKPISGARVLVYYLDPETNAWVKWDAGSSRQSNPAKVDSMGRLGLMLPGGTYYLEAQAPRYHSVITERFSIEDPAVVSTSIGLKKKPVINLGFVHFSISWPDFWKATVAAPVIGSTTPQGLPKGMPRSLPDFALPLTNGKTLTTNDLYGKPTILSFAATWAPTSHDQLAVLAEISDESINVVPVVSGESTSRLAAYAGIAQYDVPIVADVNQKLMSQLNASSVPVTYIIDRHGVIKKVLYGVRSKQELLRYALDT
jgi:peroxiredoxin